MDKLSEHFDQQIEKIAMLNDFIAVFGQRDKLKDALRVSRDTTDENRELIKRVKEKIRRFHTVLLPQAKCEIAKHERLQKIMLNMIEALDNEDADRAEQKGARGDVAQQLAPNNEETRHQVTPSSNRVSTLKPAQHLRYIHYNTTQYLCRLPIKRPNRRSPVCWSRITKTHHSRVA